VRHLSQLTNLMLQFNSASGLTRQQLLLLTGLERLEWLGYGGDKDVTVLTSSNSDDVQKSFSAAVRQQQLIDCLG
jgi:hypothetical protein